MISRPQRILGEALAFSHQKNPLKTAIIFKGEEYSYTSLKESAEKLAFYLASIGVKRGDRVAICMNNSWQCIVSIYGSTFAGTVFLVINPQTKANKLQFILNDSGAKVLISESSIKDELLLAIEGTSDIQEVILAGEKELTNEGARIKFTSLDEVLSKSYMSVDLPKIIPNDLAALIYTSGSTGFPKGVTMTHQAMVFTS